MEIREDFKVDFDSWRKEAKVLCRKSLPFIFIFSIVIPVFLGFIINKINSFIPDLRIITDGLSTVFLFTCGYISNFYTMFYFKRVDFGEPRNILNIFNDIYKTFNCFIEYLKLMKLFTIVALFLSSFIVLGSLFISEPYKNKDILENISYSMFAPVISLYVLIVTTRYLFGVVYVCYGMVNKEGAYLLTQNAYLKYPELREYAYSTSAKFMIFYCIYFILGTLLSSLNIFYNIFLSAAVIIFFSYHVAIYYLISRDLYGGKKQTQKVTENVEQIDAIPTPV